MPTTAPMQIKICGIRTPQHAQVAVACGATHIGLVFAESKRRVDSTTGRAIVVAARAMRRPVQCVGLFVNEQSARVRELVAECGLDMVQLSGDETPAVLAALSGLPIIKAVRLAGAAHDADWIASDPAHVSLLVDAHVAGSYGGAGVVADWQAAAVLARTRPIWLAGGLDPANVVDAIGQVRPWGVDVSSGVERDGHKHSSAIAAFVAQISRCTA